MNKYNKKRRTSHKAHAQKQGETMPTHVKKILTGLLQDEFFEQQTQGQFVTGYCVESLRLNLY